MSELSFQNPTGFCDHRAIEKNKEIEIERVTLELITIEEQLQQVYSNGNFIPLQEIERKFDELPISKFFDLTEKSEVTTIVNRIKNKIAHLKKLQERGKEKEESKSKVESQEIEQIPNVIDQLPLKEKIGLLAKIKGNNVHIKVKEKTYHANRNSLLKSMGFNSKLRKELERQFPQEKEFYEAIENFMILKEALLTCFKNEEEKIINTLLNRFKTDRTAKKTFTYISEEKKEYDVFIKENYQVTIMEKQNFDSGASATAHTANNVLGRERRDTIVVLKATKKDPNQITKIINEKEILDQIPPNLDLPIISYDAAFFSPEGDMAFMHLYREGSAHKCFIKNSEKNLTDIKKQTPQITRTVLMNLKKMNGHIILPDIKPENMYVEKIEGKEGEFSIIHGDIEGTIVIHPFYEPVDSKKFTSPHITHTLHNAYNKAVKKYQAEKLLYEKASETEKKKHLQNLEKCKEEYFDICQKISRFQLGISLYRMFTKGAHPYGKNVVFYPSPTNSFDDAPLKKNKIPKEVQEIIMELCERDHKRTDFKSIDDLLGLLEKIHKFSYY